MLRRHERCDLGEDQFGHRREIALALEHAGEALQIRLQPVLLDVLLRCLGELADHRVQLVLQIGDLPARLHTDLPGEVAIGDRSRHLCDSSHLVGEVGSQLVDVVGQVFPDTADLRGLRLAAQPALNADLAGNSRHLAGECVELVDHRVHCVLELEELALDLDRDLLAQVAVGHRGGHHGDIPQLICHIAGHQIDVVGQVFPDTGHLDGHRRRLTELAFGSDLSGNTCNLGSKPVELVDHAVDGVLQLQHLAADIRVDLLAEIAAGDRTDHSLHLDCGPHQRLDQAVDRFDAPGPALGPLPECHTL